MFVDLDMCCTLSLQLEMYELMVVLTDSEGGLYWRVLIGRSECVGMS